MKEFLIEKLGEERGPALAAKIEARFEKLLKEARPHSKQQDKVFKKNLLPRIAMYQVLREEKMDQAQIMQLLDDHMVVTGAIPMRKNYEKLDSLPGAFGLFKFGFTRVVSSSDLWDADIAKEKNAFSVTMRRCFWHDTFEEYGCPEMCQFACRCDDITYGGLKHIDFKRTQTLGTGGTCCDFRFTKKAD